MSDDEEFHWMMLAEAITELSYEQVGRLYNHLGAELARRNLEARIANGEDGDGW